MLDTGTTTSTPVGANTEHSATTGHTREANCIYHILTLPNPQVVSVGGYSFLGVTQL